jgi:prevent-host-death family protein
MTRLEASKAREEFSDTLNRVAYSHERIVLRRWGKDVAALVPLEDLALLEQLEDRIDIEEAKRILADPDEVSIPYSKVRKELRLK